MTLTAVILTGAEADANIARQAEIRAEMARLGASISGRFEQAEAGDISYSTCDEKNADDREALHSLGAALSGLTGALNESLSAGGPLPTAWQRAA